MLTEEQVKQIKAQILEQIKNHFEEGIRSQFDPKGIVGIFSKISSVIHKYLARNKLDEVVIDKITFSNIIMYERN